MSKKKVRKQMNDDEDDNLFTLEDIEAGEAPELDRPLFEGEKPRAPVQPLPSFEQFKEEVAEVRAFAIEPQGNLIGVVDKQGNYWVLDTSKQGVYNLKGKEWSAPLTAMTAVQKVDFPSILGERLQESMLRVGAFSLEDLRRDEGKRMDFLRIANNIFSQMILMENSQNGKTN